MDFGQPGFTDEAFVAIAFRVEEAKKNKSDVICGLMVDELPIRKHLEWDGHKLLGFTDIGNGIEDDSSAFACEALTFMAVSINSNWKVPLGYFLIDSLAYSERANLVKMCLLKLNDIGVKSVSLTCDGPHTNQAMLKILGANLSNKDMRPYFQHPGDPNQQVYAILDICHMLKPFWNTLAHQSVIVDGDGGRIRWELVDELHNLQESEGFHLGNRLRSSHIQWQKQKMKVNLVAQTISASVANALEFCEKVFKIPAFRDSIATVKFIRTFDHLFYIFNSRNPLGRSTPTIECLKTISLRILQIHPRAKRCMPMGLHCIKPKGRRASWASFQSSKPFKVCFPIWLSTNRYLYEVPDGIQI